jgi:hypothetical protein
VRRLFGVVFLSVLAISPGLVHARTLNDVVPRASADLGQQVLMQFFGETSDGRASLAAAYGDVPSESPLRGLALLPKPSQPAATIVDAVAGISPTFAATTTVTADVALVDSTARLGGAFASARFAQAAAALPPSSGQTDYIASPGGSTFISGEYRPDGSAPAASPSADLRAPAVSIAAVDTSRLAFSQSPAANAWTSNAASVTAIGPVQVHTRFDSAQLSQPQSSLTDGGYGAGADVNVRAGHRNLNFAVSSDYERLMRDDPTGSAAFSPSSNWQLPGGDVPLLVPNYADMSRVSLGAALAVPVINNLTLNLNYATDRMLGAYGLPGVNNLDATDNSYGGRLTFAIPHSSSSVSISARQLHYQDNLLPSDTFTQTREDVNFTVKF